MTRILEEKPAMEAGGSHQLPQKEVRLVKNCADIMTRDPAGCAPGDTVDKVAKLMQRNQLRAVRRMQRRIEHRFSHVFKLRRLLVRLVMQRIKPGYRSHDPALFRPVNGPSVSKCR